MNLEFINNIARYAEAIIFIQRDTFNGLAIGWQWGNDPFWNDLAESLE
jgi:hypothetical protein